MFRDSAIRSIAFCAGLGCLLHASFAIAGDIQWNKNIRQAAQEAGRQQKPLMIMVSAPWCGYCQKMMKTTFRDEQLIGHMNQCFIPVYLDADENEEWVQQLEVEGLPTTLIVSPELKVVKRLTGFQSAEQINQQIVKLCSHTKPGVPVKPALARKQIEAAFEGTCLVSLRDDGQLAKGRSEWSSKYKGQLVRFASEDHKKRFDAQPELYWPVADGNCLVSNRLERTERSGEPVLAMIYADRVWFFADKSHQDEFAKNPRPYYLMLARNTR